MVSDNPVVSDSSSGSGFSSGNTNLRKAQNRNAICSRLPMTYALMKSAMFSVAKLTSGTRRLKT